MTLLDRTHVQLPMFMQLQREHTLCQLRGDGLWTLVPGDHCVGDVSFPNVPKPGQCDVDRFGVFP